MLDIIETIKLYNSIKIIGCLKENEYNLMLKNIFDFIKDKNSIIINNGFPFPSNIKVISAIQENLFSINLNKIKEGDIVLTNNVLLNKKIQRTLTNRFQTILNGLNLDIRQKENFFVKIIASLYERINEVNWDYEPILLYYGKTKYDDEVLLKLLKDIGFKIIFINPNLTKNDNFVKEFDVDKEIFFEYKTIEDDFYNRIKNVKEIVENSNIITTMAKKATDDFKKEFNSAYLKPWEYKDGYTKSINYDAVLEDIKTYWKEDARFREGFNIEGKTITVPNFFTKINGCLYNKEKYIEFINLLKDENLTTFNINMIGLFDISIPLDNFTSLMFTFENNDIEKEVIFEKIKDHPLYDLHSLNIYTQQFIIKKYNEFLNKFRGKISNIDLIKFLYYLIKNKNQLQIISSFDFPFKVPKYVIYLEEERHLDLMEILFIHYLNIIGFDLIFLVPNGSTFIENNLFGTHLNIIDLEEIRLRLSYQELINQKPKETKKRFFF